MKEVEQSKAEEKQIHKDKDAMIQEIKTRSWRKRRTTDYVRQIRQAPSIEEAMGLLMEASSKERRLRNRVRSAVSLELALEAIMEYEEETADTQSERSDQESNEQKVDTQDRATLNQNGNKQEHYQKEKLPETESQEAGNYTSDQEIPENQQPKVETEHSFEEDALGVSSESSSADRKLPVAVNVSHLTAAPVDVLFPTSTLVADGVSQSSENAVGGKVFAKARESNSPQGEAKLKVKSTQIRIPNRNAENQIQWAWFDLLKDIAAEFLNENIGEGRALEACRTGGDDNDNFDVESYIKQLEPQPHVKAVANARQAGKGSKKSHLQKITVLTEQQIETIKANKTAAIKRKTEKVDVEAKQSKARHTESASGSTEHPKYEDVAKGKTENEGGSQENQDQQADEKKLEKVFENNGQQENAAKHLSEEQRRLIEINRQVAMHRAKLRQDSVSTDFCEHASPSISSQGQNLKLTERQLQSIAHNKETATLRAMQKRKRSQRNIEDPEAHKLEPEAKVRVAKWAGLDDDEGDICSDADIAAEVAEQHDPEYGSASRVPDEGLAALCATRRRLYRQTAPFDAPAYPQRPLLKRDEFKIKAGKFKEAQKKEWRAYKASRLQAIESLSRQTDLPSNAAIDSTSVASGQMPHPSHHIAVMPYSDVIYCKGCACWSQRTKLRGLESRCSGLKEGNASTLRLLQCGVKPAPLARLPPQLKKRRARKSRW